ncbi:MAG: tRNA (adenosine(37)-N6)-threonylcarbamoyltransferase complex dimerization subunit type 1 TsaB [Oscillospiraceae bacterium]|nr:tRNA (adenosine(37)-N6)-threonylcarbamoyltransferase complex dimerization subunit type 1 TsaB [Oscillospiraceae bacterium]
MKLKEEKILSGNTTILGLDSSAISASCAIVRAGEVIATASIHSPQKTHSQTLMPLLESVLKATGLAISDIDIFAVSSGPGSFTGLRISVSAIKGMAFALNKPVCGVSTLMGLAYNLIGQTSPIIACAVMDARRNEVYNALFRIEGEKLTRLTPDRAIPLEMLEKELELLKQEFCDNTTVILVGDGANLAHNFFEGKYMLAPEILRLQNAVSVCIAANENECPLVSPKELMPKYIRKPQAERERLERKSTHE